MIKKIFHAFQLILFFALLVSCTRDSSISFSSDTFRISITDQGYIGSLVDLNSKKEYLQGSNASPLIAIVYDGKLSMPESFVLENETAYNLSYAESRIIISLKIAENPSHISFKISDVSGSRELLEAVIWGPYETSIKEIIGENIGVVRDGDFAIGMQSLNPKTTAGKLDNIQGIVSYHGTAAEETEKGSVLQAFAINRSQDLSDSKWDGWVNRYSGRPYDILNEEEGFVTGSALALFACSPENVVSTIGKIEVTEGLPHPMIDGVWIKESSETGRAYVISPFTESNVDQTLDWLRKSGLRSLYHEDPFETWGNFKLRKDYFPNGREGLKACVTKAKEANLYMGVHTLTNFITPDDAFVTPIPDPRLAILGSTTLLQDISATVSGIEIADTLLLKVKKNSKLNTVRIGEELIQYGSFSEEKPFKLYDCKRGAWGTIASAHSAGDTLVNLLDFAYRTFYPNWDMQNDMVKNITDLINETGITQMGFDGHEGCYATGHGDYAMDKYANDWYNLLDHVVINSSSRLKHYYWHINHFINWGEPWYGGFRESQSDRRFKVQPFLERNYLRNMLGWFMIKSSTIPGDIEWMMARAAGYNAGFAMVLRESELLNNPYTDELLGLIKIWEEARLAGVFSDEQCESLRNNNNEFHLEKRDDKTYVLNSYTNNSFEHEKKVLQPGEPTDSEWNFKNDGGEQKLRFRLTIKGEVGKVENFDLEFDRSFKFNLPKEALAGYSLVCDGSEVLRIYDQKGRFIETFDMGRKPPVMRKGTHYLRFDCQFKGNDDLKVNLIVKQKGAEEIMQIDDM